MTTELEKLSNSLFNSEAKLIGKVHVKTHMVDITIECLGNKKHKTKCIFKIITSKGTDYFAYESDIDIHEIVKGPNKTIWLKQRLSELFMDAEYFASDLLERLKLIVIPEHFEHIRKIAAPDQYSAMSRSSY
jgi:hypothetical protein